MTGNLLRIIRTSRAAAAARGGGGRARHTTPMHVRPCCACTINLCYRKQNAITISLTNSACESYLRYGELHY